jgi:hypothetical protein
MTDRDLLESVCQMFEAAASEAENIASGRKGMQVPYQHEFAGTLHLPSVVRDVRRWARTIRAHLDGRGDG